LFLPQESRGRVASLAFPLTPSVLRKSVEEILAQRCRFLCV
jgi:hypothetical protein